MKDGECSVVVSSLICRLIAAFRILRGGNSGSAKEKNPQNKIRELGVFACLIEHPTAGLILYETGCAEDLEVVSNT